MNLTKNAILILLNIMLFCNSHYAQNTANTATLYISSGTTMFIGGDFTNKTGASTEDQGIIQLDGNWTDNGTFTPGTGTVIFSGASPQTMTSSGGETFANLTINNSSATGVTLNNAATVSGSLALTDGILFTTAANLLTLLNGAAASSGSAASFVDGPMKKIGNQAFVFPMGDNTIWARLGISVPSVVSDEFTVQYFDNAYSDLSVDGTLNNVSNIEYWTLDRNAGASTVTVKLFWEDAVRSGITDFSSGDLVVARYDGVDWTSEDQLAITSSDPGDITSNTVSTFSPFTFGSLSSSDNPLPIELLDFTAKEEGQNIRVKWTTANETNNDFFTVERSEDAVVFEKLLDVPGAGNSNSILYYSILDDAPFMGVSYYRLKQTDFDGSFVYSQTVAVNLEGIELINIFPVPADDFIEFIVYSASNTAVFIEVTDALGRTVVSKNMFVSKGENRLSINISSIASGIYALQLTTQSGMYSAVKGFIVGGG